MKPFSIIIFFIVFNIHSQSIGEFTSIQPVSQNTDLVIPSSHSFQTIITQDDPLTQGGTLPRNTDFTGYVPISGSSENGYLSINAETNPGGVSILDINYNSTSKLWATTLSAQVDFSSFVRTIYNCSGTVTPWNTIISCEEHTSQERLDNYPNRDENNDGYDDLGWAIEIDPASKTVIDKLWALGNFKHENLVIHNNQRTAYQGADATIGYLYKFIADTPQDLSSGRLYVYKGSKNGPGNWIQINNTTKEERNTTVTQSTNVGATVFNGIEDVEIGPDGYIYFAVKNEDQVYRFQDSDPINGTTVVNMETFVGNASYNITHDNGTTNVNWGYGNDNLAFDNDGNLWVLQDGDNNYIWVVKNGHTQANPLVEIFGIVPLGAEPTGITFSPDFRFLFMSVMHPNSNNNSTTQTDAAGNEISFNKSTSIVIALNDNLGATVEYTWYLDADNDGYAIAPTVTSTTNPGIGYTQNVLPLSDCDDNNPNVHEISTWYVDADGDGYTTSESVESCGNPGIGYINSPSNIFDCDDTDNSVFEVTTWYLDADGDGHSNGTSIQNCNNPGNGYVQNITSTSDCDDNDASVFEISTWYVDADGDGYTTSESVESCGNPGIGYINSPSNIFDCDDTDSAINPETIWTLDLNEDGMADNNESIRGCENPGAGYTSMVLTPFSQNETIIIYPNPTKETVLIDLGKTETLIGLTIVNSSKQLVFSSTYNEKREVVINLALLASGVYYITLYNTEKEISAHKIIKH
tara:strand:- start:20648 stop:22897 length:2250 start_codon:yes stop_codon:yes gene_type:complete